MQANSALIPGHLKALCEITRVWVGLPSCTLDRGFHSFPGRSADLACIVHYVRNGCSRHTCYFCHISYRDSTRFLTMDCFRAQLNPLVGSFTSSSLPA